MSSSLINSQTDTGSTNKKLTKAKQSLCVVPSCTITDREIADNLAWHNFPNPVLRKSRREKWIEVIRALRGDGFWEPFENSRICSRHFNSKCYPCNGSRTLLQIIALPTLNLTGNGETEDSAIIASIEQRDPLSSVIFPTDCTSANGIAQPSYLDRYHVGREGVEEVQMKWEFIERLQNDTQRAKKPKLNANDTPLTDMKLFPQPDIKYVPPEPEEVIPTEAIAKLTDNNEVFIECPNCKADIRAQLPIGYSVTENKTREDEVNEDSSKELLEDIKPVITPNIPNSGTKLSPVSQTLLAEDHRYAECAEKVAQVETAKNHTLEMKIGALRGQVRRRDNAIEKLKKELEEAKEITAKKLKTEELNLPAILKELIENEVQSNQLRSSKGMSYSDAVQDFAVELKGHSLKAYEFIRGHLQLPHPKTITMWKNKNKKVKQKKSTEEEEEQEDKDEEGD